MKPQCLRPSNCPRTCGRSTRNRSGISLARLRAAGFSAAAANPIAARVPASAVDVGLLAEICGSVLSCLDAPLPIGAEKVGLMIAMAYERASAEGTVDRAWIGLLAGLAIPVSTK